ncbi:MAG: SUKH-3 domain-containing protein [Nitrospira sp.]
MSSLQVRTARYVIRMTRDQAVRIADELMKAFGGDYLKPFGGSYTPAETYEQATVLVTDAESEAARALQDGRYVLFLPLSDHTELPKSLAAAYNGRIALIWGERPTIFDTASAVSQFRPGGDGIDWVRVPDAIRTRPLPIDTGPDWINNFWFVRPFDGFNDDGSPLVSPKRGYVTDPAEHARLLGYLTAGAIVVDNWNRGPDLIDPTRQLAVPSWFRTDGLQVWTGSVEYYLRWHNVAPEPEFREDIQRHGFACPRVGGDVVAQARAATDNRAWMLQGRLDAYLDDHPEWHPGDPTRFPQINERLVALGWRRGRDLGAEVDDWLARRLAGLPAWPDGAPYTPFPAALAVMREFGGLLSLDNGTGKTMAQTPFAIYPQPSDALVGYASSVQGLGRGLGLRTFQIGEVEQGLGALVVDESGRAFMVGPVTLFAGGTIDEALNRMLQGIRCEKLSELERHDLPAQGAGAARMHENVTSLESSFAGDLRRLDAEAAAHRIERTSILPHSPDGKAQVNARRKSDWAEVKMGLGGALSRFYERETVYLEKAVVAFRDALQEVTRERSPVGWAETQKTLGDALQQLGRREKGTTHLNGAIAAYREALKEYTRPQVPLKWAETQTRLANALVILSEREGTMTRLLEGVAAYRETLTVFPRDRGSFGWAETPSNLGSALFMVGELNLGTHGLRTARFEKAVAAHRDALKELTRGRDPFAWAVAQNNLSHGLFEIGRQEDETLCLEEAIAAYRDALKELTREPASIQWALAIGYPGLTVLIVAGRMGEFKIAETAVEQIETALVMARDDEDMPLVVHLEAILPEARRLLAELQPLWRPPQIDFEPYE